MKTTVGHGHFTHALPLCSASAHCSQCVTRRAYLSYSCARQQFGAYTMPMGCCGRNTSMIAPCDRITTKLQQVLTWTCYSVRALPLEDIHI